MIVAAALAERGIAFTIEGHVERHFADGSLIRVSGNWCEPFGGYYLYDPSRRQPSPAFSLMLEALRYRS